MLEAINSEAESDENGDVPLTQNKVQYDISELVNSSHKLSRKVHPDPEETGEGEKRQLNEGLHKLYERVLRYRRLLQRKVDECALSKRKKDELRKLKLLQVKFDEQWGVEIVQDEFDHDYDANDERGIHEPSVRNSTFENPLSIEQPGKSVYCNYSINSARQQLLQSHLVAVDRITEEIHETFCRKPSNQAGIEIFHQLILDMLGRNTLSAIIFSNKFDQEFQRIEPVSHQLKIAATATLLVVNGLIAFYIFLLGLSKSTEWQTLLLIAFMIQLVFEIVNETVECVLINFSVPNFVNSELKDVRKILKVVVNKLVTTTADANRELRILSAQDLLFVSHRLARLRPDLLESMVALSYASPLPDPIKSRQAESVERETRAEDSAGQSNSEEVVGTVRNSRRTWMTMTERRPVSPMAVRPVLPVDSNNENKEDDSINGSNCNSYINTHPLFRCATTAIYSATTVALTTFVSMQSSYQKAFAKIFERIVLSILLLLLVLVVAFPISLVPIFVILLLIALLFHWKRTRYGKRKRLVTPISEILEASDLVNTVVTTKSCRRPRNETEHTANDSDGVSIDLSSDSGSDFDLSSESFDVELSEESDLSDDESADPIIYEVESDIDAGTAGGDEQDSESTFASEISSADADDDCYKSVSDRYHNEAFDDFFENSFEYRRDGTTDDDANKFVAINSAHKQEIECGYERDLSSEDDSLSNFSSLEIEDSELHDGRMQFYSISSSSKDNESSNDATV